MSVFANTGPANGHHDLPPQPTVVANPLSDPTTPCACDIEAQAGPAGPILVLRVAGEIDIITRPTVQAALTAALGQTPQDLVIDMAEVRFCCVYGFQLLADTALIARQAGIGYALSGLSGHLDHIFTLLWPQEHLVRYPTAAAAVTTICIDHTYRLS